MQCKPKFCATMTTRSALGPLDTSFKPWGFVRPFHETLVSD